MEPLETVLQKLIQEGFDAHIITEHGHQQISWKDDHDECYIFPGDIAVHGEQVAWFQSSEKNQHLLKVYEKENAERFSWEPKTYNPFFGCTCLLLEWYKEHLIFIYQEKHDIYICSIQQRTVKHFNFHGGEIARKDDLVSYETYSDKTPGSIKLIRIPELIHTDPISRAEAQKLGLIPGDPGLR